MLTSVLISAAVYAKFWTSAFAVVCLRFHVIFHDNYVRNSRSKVDTAGLLLCCLLSKDIQEDLPLS